MKTEPVFSHEYHDKRSELSTHITSGHNAVFKKCVAQSCGATKYCLLPLWTKCVNTLFHMKKTNKIIFMNSLHIKHSNLTLLINVTMFMRDKQIHKPFLGFNSLSYLVLYVSALSMPSSGSLYVPTELLVPSDSLLVKFCTMLPNV
jgi:hypothetical protein